MASLTVELLAAALHVHRPSASPVRTARPHHPSAQKGATPLLAAVLRALAPLTA